MLENLVLGLEDEVFLPCSKGRVESWLGRIPGTQLWVCVFYGPYRFDMNSRDSCDCLLTIRKGVDLKQIVERGFGAFPCKVRYALQHYNPLVIKVWVDNNAKETCGAN